MSLEYLKLGVALLNILVSIFLFLSLQKVNKEKANNERITKFEESMTKAINLHGERITRIETRIEKTLTHPDLAEIHEKVNEVSDCVSRLEGEFTSARHTLALIQEHLMKGGR